MKQKGATMTDEKLITSLRGCSSDEAMWSIEAANRIEALGNACKEWAEVSQSNYQRAKAAEARAEQAEVRVAELEGALRDMIDGYQEYDLSNGKPVLQPIEKQSSWIQRARAVLLQEEPKP